MPYRRPRFKSILKYIKDRQILLIYGLMRVGKTTLLYQIIDELLSRGVEPKDILFFSFEEGENAIESLIQAYQRGIIMSQIKDRKRVFLVLDEVQKGKG